MPVLPALSVRLHQMGISKHSTRACHIATATGSLQRTLKGPQAVSASHPPIPHRAPVQLLRESSDLPGV